MPSSSARLPVLLPSSPRNGLKKAGIDDPVYAFSVHGIAGVWGTLSTGIFATPQLVETVGIGKAGLLYGGGFEQLGVQALGVVGAFLFVLVLSFIILYLIKVTIGLRVTEEEEIIGLDLSEHGTYGYPEQMKKKRQPAAKRTACKKSLGICTRKNQL